jgi:hypothetical protein
MVLTYVNFSGTGFLAQSWFDEAELEHVLFFRYPDGEPL